MCWKFVVCFGALIFEWLLSFLSSLFSESPLFLNPSKTTDPHMGNILVSTDMTATKGDTSVPVLLDFGLTKRLSPSMKVAFARLMHASDEHDIDALVQSFEEMGLKWRRDQKDQDPFEDMANMQASLRNTVPQDEAKRATQQRQAAFEQRREAKRQEAGLTAGQSLRNPVEAWPAELVFFGRVTNLLKGLCSRLGVRYPYLFTMAQAARMTLREAVPLSEHATQLIHPSSTTKTTAVAIIPTTLTATTALFSYDNLHRRLIEAIQQLDQEGYMVGLQLVVRYGGSEVVNVAAGVLGTANPRPMTPQTLVNVFSVSKALLSIGVLRLVQDGVINSLDDPVSKYWPAFVGKDGITIRHALSHQAGLANSMPRGATLDTLLDWKGMKQFLAKHAIPEHAPGTQTKYHFLTYCWLCGGIIEGVTGKPYEDYLNGLMEQHQITPSDLHVGGLPDNVENKDLAILSVLREISVDFNTERVSDSRTEKTEEDSQSRNGEAEAVATQSSLSTESSDTRKEEIAGAALQQATLAGKANTKEESERDKNYKKVLAKYQGQKHLLNPSIFNMRKVRASKVPSANVHASAASLAAVLDSLNRRRTSVNTNNNNIDHSDHSEANEETAWFGALLDPHMVDQARQPQPLAPELSTKTKTRSDSFVANATTEIREQKQQEEQQQQQLLSDSTASFGLGFQVHEFTWRVQSSSPKRLLSLGHAGLGGSVVLTLPEIPLTVAFTSNQLDKDGRARNKLLEIVFDEFGLDAPASML
jgi:CubicO group peptidase (beta-lactamase class C family)